MSDRITATAIRSRIDYLNRRLGLPLETWNAEEKRFNAGVFYLSLQKGFGYAIERITNETGAAGEVLSHRGTLREVALALRAIEFGLTLAESDQVRRGI